MASTVFANNAAVATTKSDHIAHVTGPGDERLVDNKVKTLLPNYLETTFLLAKLPTATEFNGGKIWVTPSELGPPSKPVDTWPGTHNGAKRNGKIVAASGQGSKNVYVEGKKVLCFKHLTKQNDGNSDGIIDDKAGFDKWMAEYKARAAAAAGAAAGGGGGASTNVNTVAPGPGPKPPPPPPTETAPEAKPDVCAIKEVVLSCQHDGGRNQGGAATSVRGNLLEVVPAKVGDTITMKATMANKCGEHPKWLIAGWVNDEEEGETATFRAMAFSIPVLGSVSNIFNSFCGVFDTSPRVYDITCIGHDKRNFTRTVHAFPQGEISGQLSGTSSWASAANKLTGKLKSMCGGSSSVDAAVKVLLGAVSVACGWAEDNAPGSKHLAHCYGKIEGQLTIIQVTIEIFPIPIPGPLLAIQKGLDWINTAWKWAFGSELFQIGLFIRFDLSVYTKLAITRKRYYRGEARWAGSWTVGGKFQIDFGLKCKITDGCMSAEMFVSVAVQLEGKWEGDGDPGLAFAVEVPPVKGTAVIKWDFRSYALLRTLLPSEKEAGEIKKEVDLFGGGKWPLGTLSLGS